MLLLLSLHVLYIATWHFVFLFHCRKTTIFSPVSPLLCRALLGSLAMLCASCRWWWSVHHRGFFRGMRWWGDTTPREQYWKASPKSDGSARYNKISLDFSYSKTMLLFFEQNLPSTAVTGFTWTSDLPIPPIWKNAFTLGFWGGVHSTYTYHQLPQKHEKRTSLSLKNPETPLVCPCPW